MNKAYTNISLFVIRSNAPLASHAYRSEKMWFFDENRRKWARIVIRNKMLFVMRKLSVWFVLIRCADPFSSVILTENKEHGKWQFKMGHSQEDNNFKTWYNAQRESPVIKITDNSEPHTIITASIEFLFAWFPFSLLDNMVRTKNGLKVAILISNIPYQWPLSSKNAEKNRKVHFYFSIDWFLFLL